MTEDKPIAKPIIDDATREKMALMFSGEVYLPDDVDGFFHLQAAQRDLQLELNATPLTSPKTPYRTHAGVLRRGGEGLYLECPVYANWGCNTYWGERCYANFNLTLVDDGDDRRRIHTHDRPQRHACSHRPSRASGPALSGCPVFVASPHRRERLDRRECHRAARGAPSGTTRSLAPTRWSPRTSPPTRSPMAARAR